jgi:hypothetical protein
MTSVSEHFRRRVRERIGPDTDAAALAAHLLSGVAQSRSDVVFVARISRSGRRLFRFRMADQRAFYALIDTDRMDCITVMPPGFIVPREGKSNLQLMEKDL